MAIMETILSLHPLLLILGFSFLITIISVFAYKFFTNQVEMKQLKEDLKKHQKEMKDHRDNQKKMLEIQKKAMEKNLKYMQHPGQEQQSGRDEANSFHTNLLIWRESDFCWFC